MLLARLSLKVSTHVQCQLRLLVIARFGGLSQVHYFAPFLAQIAAQTPRSKSTLSSGYLSAQI